VKKGDTVTFKVDPKLLEVLQAMPNRSEFIRNAILSALENTCPLCCGTGVLSPGQSKSWEKFTETHVLRKCDECNEVHMVCKMSSETELCPE
jgi:hypothetical protein